MAEFDVPFTPPTFDVYRLAQESAQEGETVVGVKLTDECLNALAAAHKRKTRLKLEVDEQGGGVVRIGDTSFRFATQSLPIPFADAVSCQPGVAFKAKASVGLKLTIQATHNSFEETRAKAQKLMQEEKSKGTKDVNVKSGKGGKKSLSGPHAAAALAHERARETLGVNKQMTSTLGGGIHSRNASPNIQSTSASAAAAAQARILQNRVEIMKKTLRERVIHLVVTSRFKSTDEVIGRLRKDGLSPEQDSRKAIEELIREVSETSESGRIFLKHKFFSEVNLKWKWLSTEETNYIRKLQNPTNNSSSNTSFAPSRKSGVDRVMAPSATLNNTTHNGGNSDRSREKDVSRSSGSSDASISSSPEGVDERTPPKGLSHSQSQSVGGMGVGGKKRSASPPSHDPCKEVNEEEEMYYATSFSSKRKAHAPPSSLALPPSVVPSKMTTLSPQTAMVPSPRGITTLSTLSSLSTRPVRQESASPPEDPTMAKEEMRGKASKMTSVSPRPPFVPPSSTIPPQPSSRASSTSPRTDWNTLYGMISTGGEADTYKDTYTQSYAEYEEAHTKLSKIADEFAAMEKELTRCAMGSREAERMEARIQTRYSYYEKDLDFIKLRTRHADLRSKLTTIRSRLDDWDARR